MGIFNKINKIFAKKDNIETNVDNKKKINESKRTTQEDKIISEKSSKVKQLSTESTKKKIENDSNHKIESKLDKTLSKTREGFFNKMKFFFQVKTRSTLTS